MKSTMSPQLERLTSLIEEDLNNELGVIVSAFGHQYAIGIEAGFEPGEGENEILDYISVIMNDLNLDCYIDSDDNGFVWSNRLGKPTTISEYFNQEITLSINDGNTNWIDILRAEKETLQFNLNEVNIEDYTDEEICYIKEIIKKIQEIIDAFVCYDLCGNK